MFSPKNASSVVARVVLFWGQRGSGTCCKDYPVLGYRSVFYPYSSVGNTFTSGIGEDTCSNLASDVSFLENACACGPETDTRYLPGSPGSETKRVGQRTDVYVADAPQIPPFRGGESVVRNILGWVTDQSFTPKAQKETPSHTYVPLCSERKSEGHRFVRVVVFSGIWCIPFFFNQRYIL